MASVVAGYEPVMPTYAGKLKDKEITMLIAYLKSISQYAPQEEASAEGSVTPAGGEDDAQAAADEAEPGGQTGQAQEN
jgi:hypothetical protein